MYVVKETFIHYNTMLHCYNTQIREAFKKGPKFCGPTYYFIQMLKKNVL